MFRDTFERETSKVSDEVKEQIEGLKTSFANTFNNLSDIMLEEFEAIRSEFQSNMSQYCPMHHTIEHLTLLAAKTENDISHLSKRQDFLDNQIAKLTPKDFQPEIRSLQEEMQSTREDYKNLYDQITDVINSINEEVGTVKSELDTSTRSIETMKASLSDIHQTMKISSKVYV